MRRSVTRIYFPNGVANAEDFALNLVEVTWRGTLIARKSAQQEGQPDWDVVMQGPEETAFFDCGV